MTQREENEVLAQWAGLECWCSYPPKGGKFCVDGSTRVWEKGNSTRYWGNCPRHSNNGNPPDYDRDEVAIKLLTILSKEEYELILETSNDGFDLAIWDNSEPPTEYLVQVLGQPTIAAAIKAAVLQLIEKEQP